MKNKSAQFINTKGKQDIRNIAIVMTIVILIVTNMAQFLSTRELQMPLVPHFEFSIKVQLPWRDIKVISPLPSKKTSYGIQKAYAQEAGESAKLIIEKDPTRKEIREVFGEYADKAFLLLGCENEKLNPNAVNEAGNYPVGSRDVGIFQINNHWQNVGNENFLKDPSINIRMAWNIFKRDGYSFKLWTCGRKLGI